MANLKFSGINPNVFFLGIASFFNDVSSEMIFPLLPIFLSSILGASSFVIGLIEGIADSASSLLDIFVGYFSDLRKNRKSFVLAGYGISSFSKFFIALSNSWQPILAFRAADRIGKSIRTSPRDAIIASSCPAYLRGKAFGLHRAMDTLGAVVGPLAAWGIISLIGNSAEAFRLIFLLASVPAFLVLLIIILFVKEPKPKQNPASNKRNPARPLPSFFSSLRKLSPNFRRFLLVSCFFSLSYFSFAFLILRASQSGIGLENILAAYAFYNVIYALFSIPIGQWSDKIGRKPVIVASFLIYSLVLAGFAYLSSVLMLAVLLAFYAIFVAADESVSKAFIADLSEKRAWGMALGAYNSAVGATYLISSLIAGALWAALGPAFTFLFASFIAFLSAILMAFYVK